MWFALEASYALSETKGQRAAAGVGAGLDSRGLKGVLGSLRGWDDAGDSFVSQAYLLFLVFCFVFFFTSFQIMSWVKIYQFTD